MVDSNGNVVKDYNGTLQVSYAKGSEDGIQFYVTGAQAGVTTQTVNMTNGVATVQVEAGMVPGVTDTLDTAALTLSLPTACHIVPNGETNDGK